VLYPATHSVRVFRNDGSTALLHAEDDLTADPVLPGFSCRVGNLFGDGGHEHMALTALEELLKLPPDERFESAMALCESLEDSDREEGFALAPELAAELDRRWAEHVADPGSAIPWEEVRKELRGNT
jgi:putative addiction module component (TIGR02574 family)